MTSERWIGVIVGLVTAIVTLVLLALLEQRDAASAPAPPPVTLKYPDFCVTDIEARERIRGHMFEAMDNAQRLQFEHLFQVWMKDDRGQPERARVGVHQALVAFKNARILVNAWDPPVCN
jgi:hypothetical protein